MARRPRKPPALPPLLDYIERGADIERHQGARDGLEKRIAALYQEQAGLLDEERQAPAAMAAAIDALHDLLDQVAEAGDQAPPQLVDHVTAARGQLDQQQRRAADRARRLSELTPEIEAADDERHRAGQRLRAARSRETPR